VLLLPSVMESALRRFTSQHEQSSYPRLATTPALSFIRRLREYISRFGASMCVVVTT
jgi:hypothetical protein